MVELDREELYKELEEMENDLRLYPIEEGLEDDIIDYINEKELSKNEKWDLENRLEDFFYGALKISSMVLNSNAESLHTTLQMDLNFMLQKSI